MLGFWIIATHLVGAYLMTSEYITSRASSSSTFAAVAAALYIIPFIVFLPLTPLSILAVMVARFVIIRFSLIDYIVWARNMLAPRDEHTSRVVKEGILRMESANVNQLFSLHAGSMAVHTIIMALAIILL